MNISSISNNTVLNRISTYTQKSNTKETKNNSEQTTAIKTDSIEISAEGKEAYLASINQTNEDTMQKSTEENDANLNNILAQQKMPPVKPNIDTAKSMQAITMQIKTQDSIEISAEGKAYAASLNQNKNVISTEEHSSDSQTQTSSSSEETVDLSAKSEAQLRSLVSNHTISQSEMNEELASRQQLAVASNSY